MEKINKQLLERLELYSYPEDYEFLSLNSNIIKYVVTNIPQYMEIKLH
jgi:hypothetical protein